MGIPDPAVLTRGEELLPERKFHFGDNFPRRRLPRRYGPKVRFRVVVKRSFGSRQATEKAVGPGPGGAMDLFDGKQACKNTIMVLFLFVTEKRKPTYDLEAFKVAAERMRVTVVATCTAAALGFGRAEMTATIQTMQRSQFYKSMTSHADHRIWQDVYHVPSSVGTLYVKFTADAVTEFVLLSFKEKGND